MKALQQVIKYFDDNMLSKKRIENFLLVQKEISEKKSILESKPYRYVIEPNNSCNLSCPLCPTGLVRQKIKYMSFEQFKYIIDNIKEYALELSMQNWGESTLNKDLIKMISYASKHNIFIDLSTNFSIKYSDEYLYSIINSGLSLLQIDLDGIDEETYSHYRRGGDFNTVINNIKRIVNIKKILSSKYPIIKTHFMVMKHNEKYIQQYIDLASELGVDEYSIGNIQINPTKTSDWLPTNPKYIYKTYLDQKTNGSICHWLYNGMVINSDGSVSPCCIVFDKNASFGNIFTNSLPELRNNEYFQSARAVFNNESQKHHTICKECKNMTHSINISRVSDSFSIKLEDS